MGALGGPARHPQAQGPAPCSRPPRDPVNACLSLAYALLHAEAVMACHAAGLEPLLGFYHEPAFGRASLAADPIEPLRPRVDGWTWDLFRSRALRTEAFRRERDACLLDKSGRELQADVARTLASAGVAWDKPSLAVYRLDIVRGIADILGWELQVAKLRFLWRRERVASRNGEGYPVVTVRAVIQFDESQSSAVEIAVRHLVLRLYRFLLEVMDGDAG